MNRERRTVTKHQRKLLRQRARAMRHEPTHTEWLLWSALRCASLGVTFRRQVVLQGYIADFYASSVKLLVEVDGASHEKRALKDARRDRVLNAAGYRVLRFSDEQVRLTLPSVLATIRLAIHRQ